MSQENVSERKGLLTRREVATAIGAISVLAIIGVVYHEPQTAESSGPTPTPEPTPTPRPTKEERIEMEQIAILQRAGVYGDLKLGHIEEVKPWEIEGSSVGVVGTGGGQVEGGTKTMIQFDYWPNIEDSELIISTQLSPDLFTIDIVEDEDFEPTISFGFDMMEFYDVSDLFGDYVKGSRDLGNDPRTYVNESTVLSVTVRMNEQQYRDFRNGESTSVPQ